MSLVYATVNHVSIQRRLRLPADHRRLALGVRAGLLLFCLIVAALDPDPRQAAAGAVVLAVAAVVAYLPVRQPVLARLLPTVEACIAAAAVIAPPHDRTVLLPYLLAPAFAAGLLTGALPAVTTSGLAAAVLLTGHIAADNPGHLRDFATTASEWVLLAMAVGLLAAWIRRLAIESTRSSTDESYEAAYRLITQLRTVTRQLSGGLDAVSLAHGLLQSLREQVPGHRGVVLIRADGGALVPLAVEGLPDGRWDAAFGDGGLTHVVERRRAVVRRGGLTGDAGADGALACLALPLQVGTRVFGVVAVETAIADVASFDTAALQQVADQAALRLETALLFGEVRSIATAEERRRLAREIHDGIAQELASFGYALDDLRARVTAGDTDTGPELRRLRDEVTRVVGELRLSIFDLRSEVRDQIGLGTALSDYVRQVGAGASFIISLALEEAPQRLPIAIEAELLRIAQEAITNARKHAEASHLWVTCQVAPPFARLRIEDDGRGLGNGRIDSFGLEIMRERAARLGATLDIGAREPHGTFVEVCLEGPPNERISGRSASGNPDTTTGDTAAAQSAQATDGRKGSDDTVHQHDRAAR